VDDGYVRRVDHPDDKRKTWAELTNDGLSMFEAQMPLMREQIQALWRGMDDDEKRLLIHLFAKLRLNLLTRGFTQDSARRVGAPADAGLRVKV
jgi:DNA-binding MarR family transcriptional regulator